MADKLKVDLEVGNEAKANASVDRFTANLQKAQKKIDTLGTGTSFAGSFDAQLAKATARHKQFVDQIKKQNAASPEDLKAASALGSLAGTIAGGAIGTTLIAGGKAALAAAKDADDANRVLRASAIEAGVAYDQLAGKAKAFGDRTALSNGEAERTFAQLVTFANAAGRTDKLDEFTKKFSDLAAAKGINASQLGDISRQLNALTDEATDKLLNANPSAFYDKFAASLHKTAEQLTDAEKRAAVFDEVLKKGAIFDGQAEKRAASFAGEVDTLKKEIDDLTASVGKAIVPIAQFLFAGGQINRKLFRSDAEIAEIQRNQKVLEDARVKAAVDSLNATDARIAAARKNSRGSLNNFALSQITDSDLARTFNDPAARDKAVAAAIQQATTFRDDLQKRLTAALSRGGDQQFARAEFFKNINLFDQADRDKFVNDFSANYADGLRKILTRVRVTIPELKSGLSDALKTANLTSKDREALAKDFTDAILAQINAGRAKVAELGKQTDNLFADLLAKKGASNPFVAVFTDAEKAIESTRLATAALSADLQKVAADLVAANNANVLFSARLDNRLSADTLRADAAGFRGGGPETDQDFATRIDRQLKQLGFNPDDLKKLSAQQKANFIAIRQSNLLGDRAVAQTPTTNFADRRLNGIAIEDLIRGNLANSKQRIELSAGDRIDRQLAIIRDSNPTNDVQRAEADRKIIALTQNLSGKDLTPERANAAAGSREREATRLENAERTAAAERTEAAKIQKSIDKNISDLLKIAQSDGLTGVVRIINNAEDTTTVELGKRPTPRDVTDINEQ